MATVDIAMQHGCGSHDPRSNRTVQTILDAAERLFAERGVTQVSMREIVRESGQRNSSAAKYHFGTREALIVAVVERRMATINELRHRRLDQLERAGTGADLRAVMLATVSVVADQVRSTDWGSRYVQIVAQLAQWPTDSPETQIDPAHMSAMSRVDSMVLACVPALSRVLLQRRMQMIRGYTAYTLSGWIRLNGAVTPVNARAFNQQVDILADFLAAGLSGPAPAAASARARLRLRSRQPALAGDASLKKASTATTP